MLSFNSRRTSIVADNDDLSDEQIRADNERILGRRQEEAREAYRLRRVADSYLVLAERGSAHSMFRIEDRVHEVETLSVAIDSYRKNRPKTFERTFGMAILEDACTYFGTKVKDIERRYSPSKRA